MTHTTALLFLIIYLFMGGIVNPAHSQTCSNGATAKEVCITASDGSKSCNWACTSAACGNGKVDIYEDCDGGVLGLSCTQIYGIAYEGNLTCSPTTCKYEGCNRIGDAPYNCGNGKIDTGEACDGTLAANNYCPEGEELSFLQCSSDCKTYDKAICKLKSGTTYVRKSFSYNIINWDFTKPAGQQVGITPTFNNPFGPPFYSSAKVPTCGNGMLDVGEYCDQISQTEIAFANTDTKLIKCPSDTRRYMTDLYCSNNCSQPNYECKASAPTFTRTITQSIFPSLAPKVTVTIVPKLTVTTIPAGGTVSSCPKKSQGDANCNGIISPFNTLDGSPSDYDIWRSEYTGATSSINSDFDKDGHVTLSDYEVWRQHAVLATICSPLPEKQ